MPYISRRCNVNERALDVLTHQLCLSCGCSLQPAGQIAVPSSRILSCGRFRLGFCGPSLASHVGPVQLRGYGPTSALPCSPHRPSGASARPTAAPRASTHRRTPAGWARLGARDSAAESDAKVDATREAIFLWRACSLPGAGGARSPRRAAPRRAGPVHALPTLVRVPAPGLPGKVGGSHGPRRQGRTRAPGGAPHSPGPPRPAARASRH